MILRWASAPCEQRIGQLQSACSSGAGLFLHSLAWVISISRAAYASPRTSAWRTLKSLKGIIGTAPASCSCFGASSVRKNGPPSTRWAECVAPVSTLRSPPDDFVGKSCGCHWRTPSNTRAASSRLSQSAGWVSFELPGTPSRWLPRARQSGSLSGFEAVLRCPTSRDFPPQKKHWGAPGITRHFAKAATRGREGPFGWCLAHSCRTALQVVRPTGLCCGPVPVKRCCAWWR